MCGIVAINSKNDMDFPVEELLSLISIKHRGQDDSGFFRSKNGDCHLGSVRLLIIDLSLAGHQPMMDYSDSCTLVA
jgi:asparagine synthetase B (glutamine-hydrolysing)